MAVIINPENAMDIDQPLNTDPDFSSTHVFSTADVTGTYEGLKQGDLHPEEAAQIIDFTADPKLTKDNPNLYPINSEFGFIVTDFVGAEDKDFTLNPEYAEGWAGDVKGEGGEQIGLTLSDSPTDTFKTPALLGTWLAGLGGNTVKASTEHYVVMQDVLSDQKFPGDPDAVYPLDDNLIMIGGEYDGIAVADLLAGVDIGGTFTQVGDENGDGVADIKDILEPNESTIASNIAASDDYSVTLKDDGKLLYRWGNTIKRPNDIRLEANLELPEEWNTVEESGDLQPLYKITSAELVTHHLITNNPNDQLRPEDFENEAATGTLPTYQILEDDTWVSTDDYYAGDGTLYPAGTVLRDPALADAWAASDLATIGAQDGAEGFTKAWYTTMNREPFEPILNEDGTEYITGPRWRLLADKYGQDLPSVVIPLDPSLAPPTTQDQQKYEVGAETQTVLNMLDWGNPVSPLSISAGWQNAPGTVTGNGMNLTSGFDMAVYIKGDVKPTSIYSSELLLSYEEITTYGVGAVFGGGLGNDYLVGQGNNTIIGGDGEDLFVLSYGTTDNADIQNSRIIDFSVGKDVIGLVGLDVTPITTLTVMADTNVTQTVVGGDLQIAIDGVDLVLLEGVTEALTADSFLTSAPGASRIEGEDAIIGTDGDDILRGTSGPDEMYGLAGDDRIVGLEENDTIDGGTGADTVVGGEGDDIITGSFHVDLLDGGAGSDTADYTYTNAQVNFDLVAETADFVAQGVVETMINFENVLAGGGDNIITGNSEANLLNGGGGDDIIKGGGGIDILDGGAGSDTADYTYTSAQVNFDLVAETADFVTQGVVETMVNFENVLAGAGNNIITGNSEANLLNGGGGDDIINGGTGADTVVGGEGDDIITGSSHVDLLDGGAGSDTADYTYTNAQVNFDLVAETADFVTQGVVETMVNFENVLAGAGNNIITGNSEANLLNGGGGDDTFVFANGFGTDTIADFSASDAERINLAGVTEITDFSDLITNHLSDAGDGTAQIVDALNTILLEGVDVAQVGDGLDYSAADFLFA